MKLAVLVCLVAVASATKSESFVRSQHSDSWCHEHHLAAGSPSCVQNNGCCFSDVAQDLYSDIDDTSDLNYGPCHSCYVHESGWCALFGVVPYSETPVQDCISQSGCTWDSALEQCLSQEPETVVDEMTCSDFASNDEALLAYTNCVGANQETFLEACKDLYYYEPACNMHDETEYQAAQKDSIGQYFCVDENGHEIPNTRRRIAGADLKQYQEEELDTFMMLFREGVDCNKKRAESSGLQCPNAITLTTKGGVVMVNEDNDAQNCKISCSTDKDCKAEEDKADMSAEGNWCCFNGCGYACKKPVVPLQGCAMVPHNHAGQTILQDNEKLEFDADQVHDHKMKIVLACEGGWDAIPLDGPQEKELECKHGSWEYCVDEICTTDYSLRCQEQCKPFEVPSDARHQHHYNVVGSGLSYGSTRTISCPAGYGIVGGTDDVKANGFEEVECSEGRKWLTSAAAFAHNELAKINDKLASCGSDCPIELEEERELYEMKIAQDNSASIRCNVCFDDAEWRDDNGHACSYYTARPLECALAPGDDPTLIDGSARDKCRVSCGTCLLAEEKYKIREKRIELDENADRSNWKFARMKEKKEGVRQMTRQVSVTVSRRYPVNEVCANSDGVRKHATFDDISGTYVCEIGFEIMGQ